VQLQAIFALKRPVRTEFLTLLYRLTEGNPFFIEEVLKGLITAGDIFYVDGQWDRKPLQELHIPPTVQAAVQRRTAQVSAAARQLLTTAAVIGQRFDYPLLQQVMEKPDQELLALLRELVAAQLIVEASADNFVFRHALTRQTVYAELLGHERQALHRMIGAALEQLYADQLDPHVSDLAYHFTTAGAWEKVLLYAPRAGEQAQALATPHAAVEQFSRALQAAHQVRQSERLPDLYRARGLAYDIVGDFAQARVDLEMVLKLARAAANRQAEWQALLDLGQMWAARDYRQTGSHFQQALALARTWETPTTLAYSLNRMGNWHVNVDEMGQGIRYHQEALAIFEQLADQRGLAQTFDLLGMAHLLNGDPVQSAANCQQAIALWSALNERQGLASTLALLPLCGVNHQNDLAFPASVPPAACLACCEQALQIAREIGWRAGEIYAEGVGGFVLWSQGEYGQALTWLELARALAQEIEHDQWLCINLRGLGDVEFDLLALPPARQHLEQALALANQIGATMQAHSLVGRLLLVDIGQKAWGKAEDALRSHLPDDPSRQSLNEQLFWRGRIELALAQGDADLALITIA
ncbi:MAG: tetratricopeptide repeat protein, partial [Caldilineaceae bacterium]|nr:tetratricopeptide repeat protein [Caldilineaceae bacterium]